MQFPSRGRRLFLFILAFSLGPLLIILSTSLWLSWTMNPVQTFYLGTYVASSIGSGIPNAPSTARWAEKTAPGRRPEPLLPDDAVKGSDAKRPLALSPKALSGGWRGVTITPPQKVDAKELREYLHHAVYGESAWWIFVRPMLYELAGFFFLWVCWLQFRQGLGRSRKNEERHGRRTKGPELTPAPNFPRRSEDDGIRFRMERQGSLGRFLPRTSLCIPKRLESSHILLMGDTGSGKSSAIRQLLRQLEERGETAVVYDPAMDFLGEFFNPERGDLLLNPLDSRCPWWNLPDELLEPEIATAIAAAMLPEKEYEKAFFIDAPRRVLTHLLRSRPHIQDLLRWMSDPEEIAHRVKGTPHAALLDPSAPAQRAGVLSSLNLVADSLELVPQPHHAHPGFTTAEWKLSRTRWVFLVSSAAYREKVLPLHSVWLDLFILRMMEPCVKGAKPVWIVLDELASLNKLPQLHMAITENRKYGNPVVIGLQGRSQMEKRYGKDAEAMLSQPATKIFLKTSEPRAAKWISDAIGEIEVERLKESRSIGLLRSKKSLAMEIATKPLVMASEIAGLAPLHGFIKLENRVTPVHFELAKKRSKQQEFIERRREETLPTKADFALSITPVQPVASAMESPTSAPLPLFDVPTTKKEGFVWDESKGIE